MASDTDFATRGTAPRAAGRLVLAACLAAGLLVAGCAPEVGSPQWCEKMKEKPKGDWTANEAGDFAKHCLF